MRERDDYWLHDKALGEAHFWRDDYAVRLKVHESAEIHNGRIELLAHQTYRGEKLYFHAKPVVLLPGVHLIVGLFDKPSGESIGEVRRVQREGMRQHEVGQAQPGTTPDCGCWYCGSASLTNLIGRRIPPETSRWPWFGRASSSSCSRGSLTPSGSSPQPGSRCIPRGGRSSSRRWATTG